MASTAAQVSLSGAATGTGLTVDFATAKKTVTAAVIVSGTVTGGVVLIEASQDGLNWLHMGCAAIDEGRNRGISFTGQAYRYWRSQVAADVTGGGSVRVTFMEAD